MCQISPDQLNIADIWPSNFSFLLTRWPSAACDLLAADLDHSRRALCVFITVMQNLLRIDTVIGIDAQLVIYNLVCVFKPSVQNTSPQK